MILPGYELVAQLSAGKDGVSYRARDSDSGDLVEIRDLTRAKATTRRWARLSRQLQRVALLSHRCVCRLIDLRIDTEPPVVVLQSSGDSTLAANIGNYAELAIASVAVGLADLLACAHGLGIFHGSLRPSQISLDDQNRPRVDFTHFLAMGVVIPQDALAFDEACAAASDMTGDSGGSDIFSLGAIIALLHGCQPACLVNYTDSAVPLDFHAEAPAGVRALVESMLAADPLDRPLADEVCQELRSAYGTSAASSESYRLELEVDRTVTGEDIGEETIVLPDQDSLTNEVARDTTKLEGRRLGRFQLKQRLGSGATGAVYQAIDSADGSIVAVKVLHPQHATRTEAVKRFRQEAQLLTEIDNPHVAKLLEVNYDRGMHYLAMEYVQGRSLADLLCEHGPLKQQQAVGILADVARALLEPHERGIVHRDVKPENILVQCSNQSGDPTEVDASTTHTAPSTEVTLGRAKLVDFGLARSLFESEDSNLTRTGTILGTPAYMSPEQGIGSRVGPETDVYAMGATLFHALAGRPPFVSTDTWGLIDKHRNQAPPRVSDYREDVPQQLADLVDRTLSKLPAHRQADAAELLADLDRTLRGEPMAMDMHPLAPTNQAGALEFDFVWQLKSTPHALWPHVSNTERLNEAIGLPSADYASQTDSEGGVQRFASFQRLGMNFEWQEHPFEWIEGRRLSVLREFQKGPFKWLINVVELQPAPDGGTRLSHRVLIQPRSVLGRAAAAFEVGVKARRALKRVYHHIDETVSTRQSNDPFRNPSRLRAARRRRLEERLERLKQRGLDAEVVSRLGDHLAQAPLQQIARIRPLALANRLGLDSDAVVETCLAAAHEGLLVLLWDILCPLCRIPADVKDTLRELETHGHCPACSLNFELDFAESVELIFRVSPQIREADTATYCIGGPAHSPHVAAQVRLAPQERIKLELALDEGSYRLRGMPSSLSIDFDVSAPGQTLQWEVDVHGETPDGGPDLNAKHQRLLLQNRSPREQLVRIERISPRSHVLTAARATSMSAFRRFFPQEMLSPGHMVGVAAMSLMKTGLSDEAGATDVAAAMQTREYFAVVSNVIERHGGAIIKTDADQIRAVFHDPEQAVRAALSLPQQLLQHEPISHLQPRIAVDHGSVVALTIDDQLDYLGETAKAVGRLFANTKSGELTITARVASDPAVAMLLNERNLEGAISSLEMPKSPAVVVQRFRLGSWPIRH